MIPSAFRPEGLKLVVLDVDGTLYRQPPVRRAMALRLVRTHLLRPIDGWRTLRTLTAYRHAQEHLRADDSVDVAGAQIALACERTRLDRTSVTQCVERWMEREPLTILGRFVQPGLVEFLETCRARGLRIAALSDYPAAAKLGVLGIADFFDLVLCAQSPEIGVFKPHPRGLLVALQRLGVSRDECVYVGDRVDVDAAAAHAAGIASFIVTPGGRRSSGRHTTVTGYRHLQTLLFGRGEAPLAAS